MAEQTQNPLSAYFRAPKLYSEIPTVDLDNVDIPAW